MIDFTCDPCWELMRWRCEAAGWQIFSFILSKAESMIMCSNIYFDWLLTFNQRQRFSLSVGVAQLINLKIILFLHYTSLHRTDSVLFFGYFVPFFSHF